MRTHARISSALVAAVVMSSACQSREVPRPQAHAEAAHPDGGPPVVRVDPSLIASGRIVVGAAARRAMKGDLRLPAEVVSSDSAAADVGALVSGRLGSIEVREGDAVKRGDVLAYVDSPEAAHILADFVRARARVFSATRKVERQLALEQERATSAAAIDEARTELVIAEADTAAARTLLSSIGMAEPVAGARSLSARVPVRSPIDGVVVGRLLALGGPVSPEKSLFRVVASDGVVVDARWTDATVVPPVKGVHVKVLARGSDARASCEGHVLASLPTVDERTRARRVRIAPDGPCPMLVPGAYVDVALSSDAVGGASSSLVIPKDAVLEVRGAPTVFVARAETGTFTPRLVRTGRLTSEDVAIEEGLSEGERVVVAGSVLLKGELLRSELESP